MSTGVILPETVERSAPESAALAESLGYESVWLGELWGQNSFTELAAAAERTEEMLLGTGIINVYSRSPAVLAMGANSLDRLSGGRFRLGLGVSTPKAVEDLHGIPYERPIRRSHEAVELIDAFTGGEGRVDYDGEVFQVADFPALSADVPVYNAALGPANRRVTGRVCDGWLPNNVPASNLADAFEVVAEAAVERGRAPDDIDVRPWVHTAAADDPEVARDAVRGAIAYYVGNGEGYRKAVGAVYPEQADRVASEWRYGSRDDARTAVTEEMVDDLACAGTPADVRAGLRELAAQPVVDVPLATIPDGLDDATERTFEAAAPK